MTMEIIRLSKKEQWESRWSTVSMGQLTFDPEQPFFRELHLILLKYLPEQSNGRFLEVGAYPGRYLWYFYKYHDYEPWGVEYVESCANHAQKILDSAEVPAHMIVDDFFNLRSGKYIEGGGWDLVASFGFVEHFDEPVVAVAKHLEVTRPGGVVVVSVPNHAGWNGKIMRYVDKSKWKQHNCMSLNDLVEAFNQAGNNTITFRGYIGHIGLWNAGVYPKLKETLGRWYSLVRVPLYLIEKLGQWIVPNNKYTSPDIVIVAIKNK